MFTISRFAEMFGLSRSTLLYYEKIKLLDPPERSASRYRLYTEKDKSRLELIVLYRSIGVPLKKIGIIEGNYEKLKQQPDSRSYL